MMRTAGRTWRRMLFGGTDVTICIPAYNAAGFIDRTLRFAQGQSHRTIRILVTIDASADDTAAICRSFAATDLRIEVVEHRERLGWAGNANSALDRVDTEFFFLYFHDDVLLPQYCHDMRAALREDTSAASANCDLVDFGTSDALRTGRNYSGDTATRLLTLWGVSDRGTPLRAMVRSDRVGGDFRLPPDEAHALVPGQTLLMRMMAAGPSLHVPQTLYMRWQRTGGLVAGWRRLPYDQIEAGWRADLARVYRLIDELVSAPADRAVLRYAQAAFVLLQLKAPARRAAAAAPQLSDLHPDTPACLDLAYTRGRFGDEIADRLQAMLAGNA